MKLKRKLDTRRTPVQNIVLWTLCVFFVVYSFTLIYPIYWTVINSFKTPRGFFDNLYGFPTQWNWANYSEAFKLSVKGAGLVEMFVNNVIVTTGSLLLILFSSSLAAYTLSKYPFPGSKFIYSFMIVIGMLPFSGSMPSIYNFLKNTGLYGSHLGIIILNGGGFGYPFLLLYNFYAGLSWSYAESAQIDGASNFKVFLHIMLPQSFGMLYAVLILIFMNVWGDFTNIFLFMPNHPTLSVGLKLLTDSMKSSGNYPALFAAMLVATVPVGLLYIFANRKFYNMRIETGIKG